MKIIYLKPTFLVCFLVFLNIPSYALRPIEGIMMGDSIEKSSDPLDYLFQRDHELKQKALSSYKNELALYRGFIDEGRNLNRYCYDFSDKTIEYHSDWEKDQAMRSVMATLQYIGLDLSTRAIAQYAKKLEIDKESFQSLARNLSENKCSNNITVIGKRQIYKILMNYYEDQNFHFPLPTIDDNSLFPEKIRQKFSENKIQELHFEQTLELFQSLCSWGQDAHNARLMVPLLNHPMIMAFVIRQMSNTKLSWDDVENQIKFSQDTSTVKVSCENLICRRSTNSIFAEQFPRAIGSNRIETDLKKLYCSSFHNLNYLRNSDDEIISQLIKSRTEISDRKISGQFVSLITGIPSFLNGAKTSDEVVEFVKSSSEYQWNKWAKQQVQETKRELYYEEPLQLEVQNRKRFFRPTENQLEVKIDINMGELDRVYEDVGKLTVNGSIDLDQSFLVWARRNWLEFGPKDQSKKEQLVDRFKLNLEKEVKILASNFRVTPWRGDLSQMIAYELLEQISSIPTSVFESQLKGKRNVKIQFNYSPFALRYFYHQNIVNERKKINNEFFKNKE